MYGDRYLIPMDEQAINMMVASGLSEPQLRTVSPRHRPNDSRDLAYRIAYKSRSKILSNNN